MLLRIISIGALLLGLGLCVAGPENLGWLPEATVTSVQLTHSGLVTWIKDLRRSDHAPFWAAGIPAVMITDTSNFRNPFYHTALDRIETIDFDFAAKTVLACQRTLLTLASGAPIEHMSTNGQQCLSLR